MAKSPKQTIIIADTDSDYLDWASNHLSVDGITVHTTSSSDEALKLFASKNADLLVTDFHLAPINGLELLKKVRLNHPNSMVLLTGAISSTNVIIEAMKLGASDVLRKEGLNFELRPAAERALQAAEQSKIAAETFEADPKAGLPVSGDVIIGRSAAMEDVYKLVGRVAQADAPVLITGESGVGKEVVSNAVHQFSRRSNAEYVTINCAAIPSNLLESELFGHEKGAFTGAVGQRIGRFEQCDKGTLFLDEIGDMPLEVQSKLLRVLQSGEFSRVGGNQTLQSDVRILAATNKQLETEVKNGNFREDLFYRLNVVRIHIPPLRRRVEDIQLLAEFFLSRQPRRITLSADSVQLLESYNWPGNVRELENTIQRACVLSSGNVLLPSDIPLGDYGKESEDDADSSSDSSDDDLRKAAEKFLNSVKEGENPIEIAAREIVLAALEAENGNETAAAKRLGITKAALKKKIAA